MGAPSLPSMPLIKRFSRALSAKLTRITLDQFIETHGSSGRTLDIGAQNGPYAAWFPKRVAVDINTGRYGRQIAFSHTNYYAGIHNISRTYSLSYSDVTQFVSASSDFSSKSLAAGITFGYPITEFQGLRFGLNTTRSQLMTTSNGSAVQAQTWVQQNGKEVLGPPREVYFGDFAHLAPNDEGCDIAFPIT